VLDTNVLMHDPLCLFRFEEHDVFLPMISWRSSTATNAAMSEVARNAARPAASFDALASGSELNPKDGIALAKTGKREHWAGCSSGDAARGQAARRPAAGQGGQPDPRCREVAARASTRARHRAGVQGHQHARQGARARPAGRGLPDDKTLDDGDLLYTGLLPLPSDFLGAPWQDDESWSQGGHTFYRIAGPLVPALMINQFVYLESPGAAPLFARVGEITGKDRGAEDAEGLHARQERGLGRHGTQPRTELRAQPADGSRG